MTIHQKHESPETQYEKINRFSSSELLNFCTKVLENLGVSTPDAKETAECLVCADLRGISSHGVVRLPVYGRRLLAKVINPAPIIQSKVLSHSVGIIDGDNGLGPIVGNSAMNLSIQIAKETGVGWVGAKKSNHFGIGAHYVRKAISEGMIGFACSNAPPNMAPFGGVKRFLGTNPFAFGIPAGKETPLIFDASSSVVARGKIIIAAHKGEEIPEGWAIDRHGLPTTNAHDALEGAVLPFAGPKGSAISLIIDILSGVLTGASFATHLNTLENLEEKQNVGHLFFAVRTDLFMSESVFYERMDQILRMLKGNPPVPGGKGVMVPGEPENIKEVENREIGVPLPIEIVRQLESFGKEVDVEFPMVFKYKNNVK